MSYLGTQASACLYYSQKRITFVKDTLSKYWYQELNTPERNICGGYLLLLTTTVSFFHVAVDCYYFCLTLQCFN